jgi:tetratricopeptide (TPR) repeat protein
LLSLAESEYRLGHIAEAEDCYQRMIIIDPMQMEAWLDWSYILYADERELEAIELLEEAVKNNPDVHQYYYRLCVYYYMIGKHQQALQNLEIGLLLNFNDHFLIFEMEPSLKHATEIIDLIKNFSDKYEE